MRTDWKADELTPGAKVEWRQFTHLDEPVMRTGIVWDRAPDVDGTRATAWVTPDFPAPYDAYGLIAVGIASRDHPVHGYASDRPDYAVKGELFNACLGSSAIGNLAAFAAREAYKARKANGGAR